MVISHVLLDHYLLSEFYMVAKVGNLWNQSSETMCALG